jgi:hypothetical protein
LSTRRAAYRSSYFLCLLSGRVAALLAGDYRALGRASRRWGPWVLALQLPILVAWWPARAVSVGSLAVCEFLARPELRAGAR